MTWNDPKTTSNETVRIKKIKLKGGSNIEFNEHYLDKILKNNDTWTLICVIIALNSYFYTSMIIIIFVFE